MATFDPNDPNFNPWAAIGDPSKKSAFKKAGSTVAAFSAFLPSILASLNKSQVPAAQAQLDAARAVSDPYAQLQTDLFSKFAPQLNAVGNDINRTNALSQAETERQVISGPGQELLLQALANDKLVNPDWYKNVSSGSSALQQLLGQAQRDSEGALSPTEVEQMNRFLAQQGAQRGTGNSPSNTETVSNALQFGDLGQKRKQQGISNLSNAIGLATSFNPTSKTGLDTFGISSGRSTGNQGSSQFGGVTNPTSNTGANFLDQIFGQRNTIEQGKAANSVSGWDKANTLANTL